MYCGHPKVSVSGQIKTFTIIPIGSDWIVTSLLRQDVSQCQTIPAMLPTGVRTAKRTVRSPEKPTNRDYPIRDPGFMYCNVIASPRLAVEPYGAAYRVCTSDWFGHSLHR